MTITAVAPVGTTYDFEFVAVDLYRDIHKGIRAELFDVTLAAGRVDPRDGADRRAVAAHVASVGQVLEEHVVARFADTDPEWEGQFLAAREEAERRAFHLNADRP